MNLKKRPTSLMVALLTIVFAMPSFSQDTSAPKPGDKPPGGAPDESQMMTMMMELAKPGENHKLLEGLVGTWTYVAKFWANPDPAAPPMQYSGKAVTKSIMGGRYFQSDVGGTMQMPGPDGKLTDLEFKGMGIDGYDNVKKQFISSWVDNMGTGIMNSTGSYDPATKTFTYTAEEESFPGMKTKVRELLKLTDHDHHTLEFYEDRGGKEVKTMEITYVRKS